RGARLRPVGRGEPRRRARGSPAGTCAGRRGFRRGRQPWRGRPGREGTPRAGGFHGWLRSPTLATLAVVSRPSLVHVTAAALRQRLAPGRARPGDRLPPEKELAESLRISRGTLRLALERLESNGEVNRRQGSGTFVGRVAMPPAFSEG